MFPITCTLAVGPVQSPVQLEPKALSTGVKQTGCKPDHSPPSGAKVENAWSCTSTLPYAFVMDTLIFICTVYHRNVCNDDNLKAANVAAVSSHPINIKPEPITCYVCISTIQHCVVYFSGFVQITEDKPQKLYLYDHIIASPCQPQGNYISCDMPLMATVPPINPTPRLCLRVSWICTLPWVTWEVVTVVEGIP